MNKRAYLTMLQDLSFLPAPGTILYPPADKLKGNKLLRYEILSEEILAVVESNIGKVEIYWTLEQVRMCTCKLC